MGRQDFETETLLAIGGFPSSDTLFQDSEFGVKEYPTAGSIRAGRIPEHQMVITHALRGEGFDASEDGTGRGTPLIPVGIIIHGTDGTTSVASFTETASSLRSRVPGCVENSTTTAVLQAIAIQGAALRENPNSGPDGVGVRTDGIAYTLEVRSEVQAICFSSKGKGADAGGISPTLRSMGHDGSHANGGGQVAIAFVQNTRDEVRLMGGDGGVVGALAAEPGMKQQCYVAIQNATRGKEQNGLGVSDDGAMYPLDQGSQHGVAIATHEVAGTMMSYAKSGGDSNRIDNAASGYMAIVPATMAVRHLTPEECEALQGFPRGYTKIGDKTADGPRYKALGNSMAVPVMRWIGERIQMVEDLEP